jgi:hypothetical protein
MPPSLNIGCDCHQSYNASAIPKVVKSRCSNRPTVQLQKQRMVRGEVFVRMHFVISATSSRFPQDATAERVILAPIALGCHFHQFIAHAPNIA